MPRKHSTSDPLYEIPKDQWPKRERPPNGLTEMWRNRDFLIQIFNESNGTTRLTVNRTTRLPNGRWKDGISWDDLQRLKSELGYGGYDAVELYPRDIDVVDVANMRHLWVFPTLLPFGWRKTE